MSIYGKDKDEACCDFCARDSAVYRGDGRTLFVAPNELGPVKGADIAGYNQLRRLTD